MIKKALGTISESYICPITQEVMLDPVILIDGQTYEREAISDWLKFRNTSPLTGALLKSKMMIPNYALKNLILELEELVKKGGTGGEATPKP